MRAAAWVMVVAACGGKLAATADAPIACASDTDCSGGAPFCDTGAGVCVQCRFDSECTGAERICEQSRCRAAQSCKELIAALPGLPDAVYELDFDGAGPTAPVQAWCDMTTSGGGWMALLTPVASGLAPMADGVTATAMTVSGVQSCDSDTVPAQVAVSGWNALRSYACGTVTFTLAIAWPNATGATDVLVAATLQGQDSHALAIGANPIAPAGTSSDGGGATCAFFDGDGSAPMPGINTCYTTVPSAPPQLATGALTGDLALSITTGAACDPDCAHGTGMTLAELFVR